ncbi:MAG: hypothetical protein IT286_03250 [Proteobacteria bacterium]|nr:hypothetical protein [Pseudomonadota bacterium]
MKTNNNIQKLVLVALTMIGTLTQIGCGTSKEAAFNTTIESNHFIQDIQVQAVVSQYHYEGLLEPRLDLLTFSSGSDFQLNGSFSNHEEEQNFAQLLSNYDATLHYKIIADCGGLTDQNDYQKISDTLECVIKFFASSISIDEIDISDSENLILDFNFTMKRQD